MRMRARVMQPKSKKARNAVIASRTMRQHFLRWRSRLPHVGVVAHGLLASNGTNSRARDWEWHARL